MNVFVDLTPCTFLCPNTGSYSVERPEALRTHGYVSNPLFPSKVLCFVAKGNFSPLIEQQLLECDPDAGTVHMVLSSTLAKPLSRADLERTQLLVLAINRLNKFQSHKLRKVKAKVD